MSGSHRVTLRCRMDSSIPKLLVKVSPQDACVHGLRKVAGTHIGCDRIGCYANGLAGGRQRLLDSEQSRDDALDIGIDHHSTFFKCDRCDCGSGRAASAS